MERRLPRPAQLGCDSFRFSAEEGCRFQRAGIDVDAANFLQLPCKRLGEKDEELFARGATPDTEASSGDLQERSLSSPRADDDEILSPSFFNKAISRVRHLDGWNHDREGTLIILDWDDTLCPTDYIWSDQDLHWNRPATGEALVRLRAHAKIVEDVLRMASKLGRVCIVTLALEHWVSTSIKHFMPDLEGLLEELDIAVVYSRTALPETTIRGIGMDGVRDVGQALKTAAMRHVVGSLYNKGRQRSSWENVISVGDSLAEYYGIQDVTFLHTQECRCKAVKLHEKPDLDTLTVQLEVLQNWLPFIVEHDGDLQLDFEDLARMESPVNSPYRRAPGPQFYSESSD
jgi:hypothetical protein